MDRLNRLRALAGDVSGQDLLEYAMLGTLIAVVAVAAVTTLGMTINEALWKVIAASNV